MVGFGFYFVFNFGLHFVARDAQFDGIGDLGFGSGEVSGGWGVVTRVVCIVCKACEVVSP